MSIHPSLRGVDTLRGERSVLSRSERILELQKKGKLDPERDSALGLPKVRTKFRVAGSKKAKAAAPDATAAEGTGDAEAADGESA